MKRLGDILVSWGSGPRRGYDSVTLAELYREQGRFDEAEVIILAIGEGEDRATGKLIATLIKERQQAPTRYRL